MFYEYKCKCGKEKELQRPVKDRDKSVKCECGKKMKRLISNFKWHFVY